MSNISVGIASGLGNGVYLMPAIKALKLLGNNITLFVQTDFQTINLWRRCIFADRVLEPPADINDCHFLCGPYKPGAWRNKPTQRYPLHDIHECEWRSNFRMARELGWNEDPPDVSDWCRGIDRTKEFDVGIVPGSKTGIWLRKRYPGMAEVARILISKGKKVAVYGQEADGINEIPGEKISTPRVEDLPDALGKCRIVIGTDTGPAHLASSIGIPTVMIYTATSEVKAEPVNKPNRRICIKPDCRPCVSTPVWHQCNDWKCRDIDPMRVIEAVKSLS